MIDFENYVTAASVLIVALGWFVQTHLNRRNARLERHEEIRIKFLINSYGMLNHFLHKGIESREDALRFQEVLNTIFLLGRRELVDAVMSFEASDNADGSPGGTVSIGPIVQRLRRQVRDELSLDFRDDDPNSMRFSGAYDNGVVGDANARQRLARHLRSQSTATPGTS